ncbi:acyl-coenzyme A synthetase ACSM1, mitochondrial-like isoform X3 [Dasypus novemcinctus]|uniref:acyl-coenzyme A synthetase ACSM1, mitochondrial-like isoform X3 n=1 Tax=Dasypus novemcinctus TaxID=9361 RepID=UPI00265EFE0A|nr:acyl-coenzyme A synthetase ACSM1, mitochondrial-like isoform X3 [Dasypus novemcinctus]
MQWLMRFRVLWGIQKPIHQFPPAPWHLRCQCLSEAPKWNDYDSPEEFNFARDVLDYWSQMEKEGRRGPNPALWWVNSEGNEVKWSFGEMTDLTCRVANVFSQTCGLQPGDGLVLLLPRVPEWWLATVGCIRTGVIVMPGTTQMRARDILYRLQTSKAKGVVTTDALAPEVDSVASECPALKVKLLVSDHSRKGWLNFSSLIKSASPEHTCIKSKTMDPMAIFFTSGTTGYPKMAKHSHGLALRSSLPSSRKWLQLKTSDIFWCLSDPGWIVAFVGGLLEPWTAGSTVFIHHLPQFDPKVIVQGLTCAFYRGMKIKPGSMGKAIPPFDTQIIDDKGNILPPHTEGNIGIRIKPIRPIGLFLGYEGDPKKTAEVECGDFYNTGDKGTMDAEGYFWFLGRSDDVINASGFRIGPAEVEDALAKHPAVAESAVVSSPDPIRGQVVKAFIVLTPPFLSHDREQLTKELQQHVKSVTAPYKYPRKVEFVPELPKTITGKIKRSELRRKEFDQMQAATRP